MLNSRYQQQPVFAGQFSCAFLHSVLPSCMLCSPPPPQVLLAFCLVPNPW